MSVMEKCIKCSGSMSSTFTRKGVLIDTCSSCQGVWLDQGEIDFFIQNREALRKYQQEGLTQIHPTDDKCSKCNLQMIRGPFPGFSYLFEECPSCKGLYIDKHEFEKLKGDKSFLKIQLDSYLNTEKSNKSIQPSRVKLPSLAITSGMVGLLLYGILFGVMVFLVEWGKIPISWGIGGFLFSVVSEFYMAPFILDWQLKLFGSLEWVSIEELPDHFRKSLRKLCTENRLPLPKMGIIRDGSPQAYTYGRTPYSARVVFSQGMFEILDPEEVEAVLAHELGAYKALGLCFYDGYVGGARSSL